MKPAPLSRRQLLASAGSLVAPALASPLLAPLAEAFAAEPKTGSSAKPAASPKTSPPAASAAPVGPPLNRFPRAVHDFYLQQVRYACRRSEERYGKAKSPEAYIEGITIYFYDSVQISNTTGRYCKLLQGNENGNRKFHLS